MLPEQKNPHVEYCTCGMSRVRREQLTGTEQGRNAKRLSEQNGCRKMTGLGKMAGEGN